MPAPSYRVAVSLNTLVLSDFSTEVETRRFAHEQSKMPKISLNISLVRRCCIACNTSVMSDFRPEVEKWTFLRMRKKISPKLPEMTQASFLAAARISCCIFEPKLSDQCWSLSQVIWEHVDRLWLAGDIMCRVLKYAQSFSIMSSVYMLVVLSVDRHQAIRKPLRPPLSVRIHVDTCYYELVMCGISDSTLRLWSYS